MITTIIESYMVECVETSAWFLFILYNAVTAAAAVVSAGYGMVMVMESSILTTALGSHVLNIFHHHYSVDSFYLLLIHLNDKIQNKLLNKQSWNHHASGLLSSCKVSFTWEHNSSFSSLFEQFDGNQVPDGVM